MITDKETSSPRWLLFSDQNMSCKHIEAIKCEVTPAPVAAVEDLERPQWWRNIILYTETKKFRIFKNIGVLSFGFFFLFMQSGLGALQASINREFGPYSMMATYLGVVISSFFLPTLFVRKLCCKWTMIICSFGYLPWILAQLKPEPGLLIVTALISGVASTPLWTATSTYIACLGRYYQNKFNKQANYMITNFFGIFFFIYMCGMLLGNSLSSASKYCQK